MQSTFRVNILIINYLCIVSEMRQSCSGLIDMTQVEVSTDDLSDSYWDISKSISENKWMNK